MTPDLNPMKEPACELLGQDVSGNGHGKCKGPEVATSWPVRLGYCSCTEKAMGMRGM